jgi:hypothetical protein
VKYYITYDGTFGAEEDVQFFEDANLPEDFADWSDRQRLDYVANLTTSKVEVITALANVIDADTTLAYDSGGEGVFARVDTIDPNSGTLIFFDVHGDPYEVRVRRVTEADCVGDKDGVVPPPITPNDNS